jgi:6-phosphogluconolactonase
VGGVENNYELGMKNQEYCMKSSTFLKFSSQTALVTEITRRIAISLIDAINKRGGASLAVSGGTTPMPMFEALSCVDLDWDKVVVSLVDERWVDVSEKDSNENLVRSHLLKNMAASASFIGMKTAAVTASEGEKECAERLKYIRMPYDVMVLGMGGDGHTASLFPGAEKLSAAVDMASGNICMAIAPVTASHERMTLTLPTILNTREIIVQISSEEKRKVYEQAISEGPLEEMPIRYILRQEKVPVMVYWAP